MSVPFLNVCDSLDLDSEPRRPTLATDTCTATDDRSPSASGMRHRQRRRQTVWQFEGEGEKAVAAAATERHGAWWGTAKARGTIALGVLSGCIV